MSIQTLHITTLRIVVNSNGLRFGMDERWIVTAAHCLEARADIDVYLGVKSTGKYRAKVIVPAANQHIYPLYNKTSSLHDIGLYFH